MFKTLAAGLTPAVILAAGLNDGTSIENTYDVDLLAINSNVLKLSTYNTNAEDGTSELRGNLWLKYGSVDTNLPAFVQYGFCLKRSTDSKWDCMRVRTNVDSTKLAATPSMS